MEIKFIELKENIAFFIGIYEGRTFNFSAETIATNGGWKISLPTINVQSDVIVSPMGAVPSAGTQEREIYESVNAETFRFSKRAIVYSLLQLQKVNGKDAIIFGHTFGDLRYKNQIVIQNISAIANTETEKGSYLIICQDNLVSTIIGQNAVNVVKLKEMFRKAITVKSVTYIEDEIKRIAISYVNKSKIV